MPKTSISSCFHSIKLSFSCSFPQEIHTEKLATEKNISEVRLFLRNCLCVQEIRDAPKLPQKPRQTEGIPSAFICFIGLVFGEPQPRGRFEFNGGLNLDFDGFGLTFLDLNPGGFLT